MPWPGRKRLRFGLRSPSRVVRSPPALIGCRLMGGGALKDKRARERARNRETGSRDGCVQLGCYKCLARDRAREDGSARGPDATKRLTWPKCKMSVLQATGVCVGGCCFSLVPAEERAGRWRGRREDWSMKKTKVRSNYLMVGG